MPEAALLSRPPRVVSGLPLSATRSAAPGEPVFAQRKATLPDTAPQLVAPPRDAGAPLEPGLRSEMERGFGSDFSAVRIHDDAAAHDSARAINARAYAAGNDIVFGQGAYRPASTSGRALLAHELAHTVQQGGVQAKSLGPLPAGGHGELEREADRAALAVTSGRGSGSLTRVSEPAVLKAEGDVAGATTPPVAAAPPVAATPSVETASTATPAAVPGAAPTSDLPSNVKVVEETPSGAGATRLVVDMGTLKMPRVKGAGEWVEQAYKASAKGGSLIFSPKFDGGSYGTSKTVAAVAEKPGEAYKNVWLNNYGFKSLTEMAKAFKTAATAENADADVKAAYDDPAAKFIIDKYLVSTQLTAGKCDIDHIVEKQLGGTSTPGNLQLLTSDKNQESGRETYNHLKAEVARVLSPNRMNLVEFQMRFQDVQLVGDTSDGSYVIEKVLRSGKVKGAEEIKAVAGGIPVALNAGGKREVVYARKGEETDVGEGDRRLVPGLRLKTYARAANSTATAGTDTVKAELAIKPAIPGKKDVTLTAKPTTAPVEPDGSGGQSAEKKTAAGEFRKLELDKTQNAGLTFYYPYLSPGKITKLDTDANGALIGEGVITPTIKFFGDLKIRFGPDLFELAQDLDVNALNNSPALKKLQKSFRFTAGALTLDLIRFKPEGRLDFSAGPKDNALLTGFIKATEVGGNFVATGEMLPGPGLPGAAGTAGKVSYHQTQGWSGEVALPPSIPILPNATVSGKIGFTEAGGVFSPYAEGKMNATILGQTAEFTVGWSKQAGSVSYAVRLPIEKPFPLVDRVVLYATYTGGKALYMNGELAMNWRDIVTGKGKISYTIAEGKEGWFYGESDIHFKYKKLSGGGSAKFNSKGISELKASCTYQLTDKISATVGVSYNAAEGKKLEDRFHFTGSVTVSDIKLFDPWPKEPAKRTILDIGYTQYIPIPPFPAVSMTLSMTGELGARYQFGPGTIGGTVTASGYFLSDDPRLEASLDAKMKIPAFGELYGRFGVLIGAAVTGGVVGAEGGVYMVPSVRMNLLGSVEADAKYAQDKGFSFGGIAKVEGSLTGKFGIDAAVRVYFMRGLAEKEWTIPIKSWGPINLIDNFTLTLGKIAYSSETGMTWPSLSDIKLEPEKYSPMAMMKKMLGEQKGERDTGSGGSGAG